MVYIDNDHYTTTKKIGLVMLWCCCCPSADRIVEHCDVGVAGYVYPHLCHNLVKQLVVSIEFLINLGRARVAQWGR